jgi:hypothetical protein
LREEEPGGEGKLLSTGGTEAASIIVPSSENPARCTDGVTSHAVPQPAREKGRRSLHREGRELGFLKCRNSGPNRDELSEHIIPTGNMAKSTNVPRADREVLIHGEREEHQKNKNMNKRNRTHDTSTTQN